MGVDHLPDQEEGGEDENCVECGGGEPTDSWGSRMKERNGEEKPDLEEVVFCL